MSNGHTGANCAKVTASNRISFPLTNLLHCINSFFAKTAAFLSGENWGLVINSGCNGWQ